MAVGIKLRKFVTGDCTMDQFAALLSQGAAQAWWFMPTALGIGALHGLEPGHSKSLMAAFIIAVRGTWQQAIVLGLCVAVSHSAVVWMLAAIGLYYGPEVQTLFSEQRLAHISGGLILIVAVWMAGKLIIARAQQLTGKTADCGGGHHHTHAQSCDQHAHARHHDHHDHHDHHNYHDHHIADKTRSNAAQTLSAHDRAHLLDIQRRFSHGHASWGQLVLFGLSGGLIPCPASVAVLAMCLQAEQVVLGGFLVAAFSLGLALTLMASGLAAALSVHLAKGRWQWMYIVSHYAPWLSVILLLAIGLVLIAD